MLVKPLGLSFQFRNIPAGISKNRNKRDAQELKKDRTIIAQGVFQKTGTKKVEYSNIANKTVYAQGPINTVRPHPLIAMGYSYSSVAPIMDGKGPKNKNEFGFNVPLMNGNEFIEESAAATQYDSYNYTIHSLSPHFMNKNAIYKPRSIILSN